MAYKNIFKLTLFNYAQKMQPSLKTQVRIVTSRYMKTINPLSNSLYQFP